MKGLERSLDRVVIVAGGRLDAHVQSELCRRRDRIYLLSAHSRRRQSHDDYPKDQYSFIHFYPPEFCLRRSARSSPRDWPW